MKQIICPECKKTFAPADFTTRPIDGHPRLKNVGMSCPHCGWFGHLFVEDMRLRRRRATVELRRRDYDRKPTPGKWRDVEKARTELGRVFDEVQAKWRPALGLVPVSMMTDGEAADR
jgi:hypothetical protein